MQGNILLVSTEDWLDFTFESYIDYVKNSNFMNNDMFIDNLRKWHKKYTPFYTTFRGQIKEIVNKNHDKCNLNIIIQTKNSKLLNNKDNYTPDNYYIIKDDDDFLNPKAESLLTPIFRDNPEIDLVYWDCWQYKTAYNMENAYKEGYSNFSKDYPGKFGNCYALRGGMDIQKLYSAGGHNIIKDVIPKEKIFYLENEALNLWNIHSACFHKNTDYYLDNFMIINIERSERPSLLDWAAEEIEQMYLLASSLKHNNPLYEHLLRELI